METINFCNKWHTTHLIAYGERQPLNNSGDGDYLWFRTDGTIEQLGDGFKQNGTWIYDTNTQNIIVSVEDIITQYHIEHLSDTVLIIHSRNDVIGEFNFEMSRMD